MREAVRNLDRLLHIQECMDNIREFVGDKTYLYFVRKSRHILQKNKPNGKNNHIYHLSISGRLRSAADVFESFLTILD